MKASTSTYSFLFLSLIACGSPTSVTSHTDDSGAATAGALNAVTPLTEARKEALVRAYAALDRSAFDADKPAASFNKEQAFAKIDVTEPVQADGFRHRTTIMVPAGTLQQPRDPNQSRVFFVAHGPSANTTPINFGPFVLPGQAGEACGGFVDAPARCDEGLVCVSLAQNTDAPGRCQVAPEQAISGKLTAVTAIGGETTGYGLNTTDGMVELDLATNDLTGEFVEGARATVHGRFSTVQGVEIRSREVFVVSRVFVAQH